MKYLLFTTTICPKCPTMKNFVEEQISLPGEIINETHPGFQKLISDFQIMHVPTLIILDHNNQEIHRFTDPSEIQIENLQPN